MSESLSSSNWEDAESPEWLWNWGRYRPLMPERGKDFGVAIIECWIYEDEGDRTMAATERYEIINFHSDSMDSWLKESIPMLNGQQPSSGFKVAVMPTGDGQLPPLTEDQIQAFNTALGLPNFHHHFFSHNSGACGMFLQSDSSYVFILKKTSDATSISSALRYHPQTNVTRGVFHINLDVFPISTFEKMSEQFIKCSHPLLLPLLAVELTVEEKIDGLDSQKDYLIEIEAQTGHGLWQSKGESHSPSDYRALVKRLGQAQSSFFLGQATRTVCRFQAEFIHQKLQYLDRVLPEECQKILELHSQLLKERIEYLLSVAEHARIYSALAERMESQQTVLFNLIAQSDNLVNISLAKDSKEMAVASKQDSSAMKIIALLTTFFLPGTFIASFFAMPLFDWSEPSLNHVTTRHFWVFWAVTGPVTLATMAGVIAWALWNNRRVELLQSRARESVGTKSQGDNGEDTDKEQSTGNDSNEGGVTNEDQAPKSGTDGVRNLKKYSLLGILSRRRRRSSSTKAEP